MSARLTSGCRNPIVLDHPGMCHHCGFIVGEDVVSCEGCGVRAHASCVRMTDGRCDACRFDLSEGVCAICQQPEGVEEQHDAQRLIKCLVHHGHQWTEVDESTPVRSVHLSSAHEVSQRLANDPGVRIPHDILPLQGSEPMSLQRPDGRRMESRPLVVHSWCAQCAFQQMIPEERPVEDVDASWRCVVENLLRPCVEPYATVLTANKVATMAPVPCVFCDQVCGHKSFCISHLHCTHDKGCATCHWSLRPSITYLCFHPSCAVRAGMRRVILPDASGAGMMCIPSSLKFIRDHNPVRDRRSFLSQTVCFWMEACSGIHCDLLRRVDLDVDPGVRITSLRLGSLCTTHPPSKPPPRARGKRPRDAVAAARSIATREKEDEDEDRGGDEDHQQREQGEHSRSAQESLHSYRRRVDRELASLREDLIRRQESLATQVFSEMDRLRTEMHRAIESAGPSRASDPDETLLRLCDDLRRHGQRELVSFVAAVEHVRDTP